MSILTVENLNQSFGDREILTNVSFRMNKGEHIGLVGANGEGKSTFLSIITSKLVPDQGKIEWAKNVKAGYAVLTDDMTIRDVLKSACQELFTMEEKMNDLYMKMGEDPDHMEEMLAEAGSIADLLTAHDFYMIDAKIDEVARTSGIMDLGLDRKVNALSGGQRTRILLAKL